MITYKAKKVRVKVVQHRNKLPSEAVKFLFPAISELGWERLWSALEVSSALSRRLD